MLAALDTSSSTDLVEMVVPWSVAAALCLKRGGIKHVFVFGYKTPCIVYFLKAYDLCDVMVGDL